MAPHFSILTWESPWTGEPGRLQSTGRQRVLRDLATKHHHRGCPRVRLEGCLGGFPPLGGAECRGHAQYPPFAPSSSEMAVEFYLFVSFGPEFAPTAHARCYLLLSHFFALCSSRRGVFSCTHLQHCGKGPQTCLITTTIRIPLEEMAFFLTWERHVRPIFEMKWRPRAFSRVSTGTQTSFIL